MITNVFNTLIQGFLFGIALNAPMGLTNIEVIRRGIREGWKASTLFVLGNMTVFAIYTVLIMLGFSFLSSSKLFNLLLLFFGVLVLFYLAYDAFSDFIKGKDFDLAPNKIEKNNYTSGILLSFGNPALFIILMGLLGADLSANQISIGRGFLLSLGMFLGFIIFFFFFILI